jgi:phosphodiesterase/alkaline phosphatase D-like protein
MQQFKALFSFLSIVIALVLCDAHAEDTQLVRIAFGSCIDNPDSRIWQTIAAEKPDLLLLLGDTIYIREDELNDETRVRARYARLTGNTEFARLRKLVPTYATWDDHDSGVDDGDSTSPFLPMLRKVFREVWPPPDMSRSTASLDFSIDTALATILVPDGRSFRVNQPDSKQATPTLFGAEQVAWIRHELEMPRRAITILASGTSILSSKTVRGEELRDFPTEYREIVNASARSPHPVIFLSGDKHYAELLKIQRQGKSLYELSASPITAMPRMQTLPREPRRLAVSQGHAIGILEMETKQKNEGDMQRSAMRVRFKIIDLKGREQIDHTVEDFYGERHAKHGTP